MYATEPHHDLTVMSWNIHHGEGSDGRLDLPRIAELIRDSGADLVGLQEVDAGYGDRSDWAHQLNELATMTGLRGVYGANLVLPTEPRPGHEGARDSDGGRDNPHPGHGASAAQRRPTAGAPRRYGSAILSVHPVIRWSNQPLATAPGAEPRGLLGVRVEPDGLPLDFFTTHLSEAEPGDRNTQADQVQQRLLRSPRVILTGDFNAEPDDPELAALTGWTDAWASTGSGSGATYPDNDPQVRIDHLFTGPGVRVNRVEVLHDAAGASDHLPLVAQVSLS